MSSKDCESSTESSTEPKPTKTNPQLKRIQSNRMMLDLRDQVQWQSKVIRDLKAERDRLTKELASRLFFVEAQLRREQKHIESLLNEKDQYISFQGLQIESLKHILSKVDWDYSDPDDCNSRPRSVVSNASGRRPASLSKRYSVALDEYMKDTGVISRASPVVIRMDSVEDKADCKSKSYGSSRTLSMPELRQDNLPEYIQADQCYPSYDVNYATNQSLSQEVIDELAARRWPSDCDSEHSDSLDSGISSPSIKCRSLHADEMPFLPTPGNYIAKSPGPPRRSSSIGSFLNRKFCNTSERIKDYDLPENTGNHNPSSSRRHSSFSGTKTKDILDDTSIVANNEEPQKPRKFISSANRNFGTNHRNVMKPRDIKFKKLFKFRRRAESAEPDAIHCDDYMTV